MRDFTTGVNPFSALGTAQKEFLREQGCQWTATKNVG
jgi:hypothetical protein